MSEKPDKNVLKQQQEKQRQLNNIPKFVEIIDELQTVDSMILDLIHEAQCIIKSSHELNAEISNSIDTHLKTNFIMPLNNIRQSNNSTSIAELTNILERYMTEIKAN